MVIHVFGAFCGVVCSWFYKPKETRNNPLSNGNYLSDLVSMTGTLFLFVYWPSFNGGLSSGSVQYRAIINTYLSISSSVIAAIIVSRIMKGRKLDMEIILHASLAGGVVMGCNSELIGKAYGAMLAGFITGAVSSFSYAKVGPFLREKIHLHDTCGVLSLHGIPGFIAGILSAIMASRAELVFGSNANSYYYPLSSWEIRSPSTQAGFQLAALALSLGLGSLAGLIAGIISGSHHNFFLPIPSKHFFDDQYSWWECEIDHQVLYNLQVQRAYEISQSSRINFKHVINNIPTTI